MIDEQGRGEEIYPQAGVRPWVMDGLSGVSAGLMGQGAPELPEPRRGRREEEEGGGGRSRWNKEQQEGGDSDI